MILLFIQQKSKHCEMAFLTSSSVIKHVIFALGVDRATRNTVKAGYRPILVSYTLWSVV